MSQDFRKLLQDGHGRMPGVYDACGYRLSPSEAAAATGLFGPVSRSDSHWLNAPAWWVRVKPLRWAAALVLGSLFVPHTALIDLAEMSRQLFSTFA
jgi:hypothetical protein